MASKRGKFVVILLEELCLDVTVRSRTGVDDIIRLEQQTTLFRHRILTGGSAVVTTSLLQTLIRPGKETNKCPHSHVSNSNLIGR